MHENLCLTPSGNSSWLPHKYKEVQILEWTHHTLDHSCHSKTNKGQIHSKCLSTFCWARASSTDITPCASKKPCFTSTQKHSAVLRPQGTWPKDSFSFCHKLQTVLRICICNTQWTEGLVLIRCLRLKSQSWATHLIILVPGEVLRCQDKPILLGATLHDPNVIDGEPALSDDLRGWKQWALTRALKARP